jgi:hypothetical protein
VNETPITTLLTVAGNSFSNLYDVEIFTVGSGGTLTKAENLDYRAESVRIGEAAIETYYSPSTKQYSPTGTKPTGDVTIAFREDASGSVFKTLKGIYEGLFTLESRRMIVGLPGRRRIDVTQYHFDAEGKKTSIVYELRNCILKSMPFAELSWRDSTAIVYNASFTVDNVRVR